MIKIIFMILLAFLLINCNNDYEIDDLNLYDSRSHFSGGIVTKPAPKLSLLKDSLNNQIAKLCIESAAIEELEKHNINNLSQRLKNLLEGNIVKIVGQKYQLTFPVIVGEKRKEIADIVDDASSKLCPVVESMILQLNDKLKDDKFILFHILWSRMIDEVWFDAWRLSFPEGRQPRVTWVIYPEHPFTVGTNYYGLPGNGSLALTWSNNFTDHLSVLNQLRFELHQAAWNKDIQDMKAKDKMIEYGAYDTNGHFLFFSYHHKDSLDQTLKGMIDEYADAVSGIYDYKALGKKWNIPYNELFIILLHETAYSIFEKLHNSNKLESPYILLSKGDKRNSSQLTSLVLGSPPSFEDEALALFMKNHWRGNQQIVEKFKEVLDEDPENLDILFYLGLSLYDIEIYSESIQILQNLYNLTLHNNNKLYKKDWSLIWIGHNYDLLGKREKAVFYYNKVLASKHKSGNFQMAQYGIGPITAKEWAKKRIEVPYTRK